MVPSYDTADFFTVEAGLPPDPSFIGCHEITHYVHFEQIGGFAWLLNTAFGDLYSPQAGLDHWFDEGLAVYAGPWSLQYQFAQRLEDDRARVHAVFPWAGESPAHRPQRRRLPSMLWQYGLPPWRREPPTIISVASSTPASMTSR